MKERGKKALDSAWRRNDDVSSDCYYSYSSDLPCKKHPSVSAVGICPYCLNDRLVNLVCPECGEQRLSSCSCSDLSPNTSTSAAVEAGSVGRISYLLENEKNNNENPERSNKNTNKSAKDHKTEEVVVFRRSSSSCVEMKRKNHGLWRIGNFFRKINFKRDRDVGVKSVYGGGFDEKSESWVFNDNDGTKMGVSRSRSLCSFRGNGFSVGSEDGSSYSGARSSISAARSSSVNGGLGFCETEPRRSYFEGRKSGFSETENRKSGFSETEPRRSCFDGRRSNFSETEHRRSNFSETEQRRSCFEGRKSNFSETEHRKSDAANNLNRRVFSLKESYFTGGEEPGFIDLKFDLSSSGRKQDYSAFGSIRSFGDNYNNNNNNFVLNDGMLDHGGGSCRISLDETGIKKSRKSFKGWRWIFGHQPAKEKDGDSMVD